jgi:glutaredoxin
MEFTSPASGFTVYGKIGCTNCQKVKALLDEYKQEFTYINCDDYLALKKTEFLKFIAELAGKEVMTFPIVFFSATFVGGYTDTIRLLLDKY